MSHVSSVSQTSTGVQTRSRKRAAETQETIARSKIARPANHGVYRFYVDTLHCVFAFMTLGELTKCAQVSSEWRGVVYSPRVYTADLTAVITLCKDTERITLSRIQNLFKSPLRKYVTIVVISYNIFVLKLIADSDVARQITRITDIGGNNLYFPPSTYDIAAQFTNLEQISL